MHQDESPDERLTRNWNELLQELRVTQTGAQILTAFLLTVPFAARFEDLADSQRTIYLVVLSGSVVTTAVLLAPVAYHRLLFRRRKRAWLVAAAHRCAASGLVLLGLTCTGVIYLVFDVVAGSSVAWAGLGAAVMLFVSLWAVVPRVWGGSQQDLHEG